MMMTKKEGICVFIASRPAVTRYYLSLSSCPAVSPCGFVIRYVLDTLLNLFLITLYSVAQRCVLSWSASLCPPSPISPSPAGSRPNMPFLPRLFRRKGLNSRPWSFFHSCPEHRSKILLMIHAIIAVQEIWVILKDSILSSVRFVSNRFSSTTHLHSELILLPQSEFPTK